MLGRLAPLRPINAGTHRVSIVKVPRATEDYGVDIDDVTCAIAARIKAPGGSEKTWGPEHTSTLGPVNDGGEESVGTRRKESHALHYLCKASHLIIPDVQDEIKSSGVVHLVAVLRESSSTHLAY